MAAPAVPVASGGVVPESFTRGSSEQRAHGFQTGLTKGELAACNMFDAAAL